MATCRTLVAAGLAGVLFSPLAASAQELPARVDWGERFTVSAPLAGVVTAVAVSPGDRVDAGQVLFTLDIRRLRAAAGAATAERDRLRLELAETDREVARAEELYDRTLIAVRELELARIHRSMAASRLARAEAELQKIRVDLEDSSVRAPAAGRVLSVAVTVGEAVSPALAPPVLATLGTVDPMRAETTVDAGTAGQLQPGQAVSVDIGLQTVSGSVQHVGWEVEDIGFGPGYRVGVRFTPPESLPLRAGQDARIRFDER